MNQSGHKKIALVHDFLVSYGGAERVLQAMAELYPEAPIYTLVADPSVVAEHFPGRDIRTSWLSRLPNCIKKRYRFLLPFFPVAVETFDLRDFDRVISSSGAWSKGIVTRLNTKHIAYVHSPMRYAWDYHEAYLRELGMRGRLGLCVRMLMSYLRVWDRQAAERPDEMIANSDFTRERIRKYYRRESTVIYPPALSLAEQFPMIRDSAVERKHFLVVSRLTSFKKIDAVIEAFNKLGFPLIIVGVGPEQERLKKMAQKNIVFAGFVADNELAKLYSGARALVFPSEEDFGMVAVEALSFSTPVIAFEYGGIREIVSPGKDGELFHAVTPEIIAEGVKRFLAHEGSYDKISMQRSVERFGHQRFADELKKFIEEHS
jgi:glycosyltransferase involved in cell wall biosynthesis